MQISIECFLILSAKDFGSPCKLSYNLREMSYSVLVEKIRKFTTPLFSAEILHSMHSIKVNVLSIPK